MLTYSMNINEIIKWRSYLECQFERYLDEELIGDFKIILDRLEEVEECDDSLY